MVLYLRQCLCYDAGVTLDLDSIESNLQSQAPLLAVHIADMLSTGDSEKEGPLAEYIDMIRKLLNVVASEYLRQLHWDLLSCFEPTFLSIV